MRVRTTFWLLAAVLFTGALHLFFQVRDRAADGVSDAGRRLTTVDMEAVDWLVVETADWRVECRKVKGRWRLTAPLQGAADAATVGRILGELSRESGGPPITPAHMNARGLTPASFGLETPRARIACGVGDAEAITLLLGDEAPFGDALFARREGLPEVFTIRTNLLAAIPPEAVGFRDRRLFEGKASALVRVDVERREGGFVSFAREDDEWHIRQPIADRADGGRMRDWLAALLAVEVEDVVATLRADPAAYGLSPETVSATVTLWEVGDPEPTRLDLGLGAEQGQARAYARFGGGGAILSVSTNVLSLLGFRPQEFRDRLRLRFEPGAIRSFRLQAGDRRLVATRGDSPVWRLTEPVQVRGDLERIRAFLGALPSLAAVGFEEVNFSVSKDSPLAQVWLFTAGTATGTLAQVGLLRLWGAEPGEDGYRADTGTGTVFRLSGAAVRQVFGAEQFWDPLRFRDREMLALAADSIKRMTVVRGDVTQTVDRDEKGHWIAHDGRQANRDAVEAMVGATHALRALRLEAPDADRTDGYGFESPSARVEYGLGGEAGIQKTLVFGGTDEFGNRYVRVQGEDLVFVLAPELADILTRDLLQ